MRITLIGHDTLLIETGAQRILTDPYFGTWGNPMYRRAAPPARRREELRDVSLVLLSHTHWDHVDGAYLRALDPSVPVWVPWPSVFEARLLGAHAPRAMHAWQACSLGDVTITPVPAVHLAFTLGYVIASEGRQVYFAGDTFYNPSMRAIGQRFQLDAALMPVTTYRLPMTMGEKGAVRAAADLHAGAILPIYLGIEPRSPLLRTDHSVAGFERRLHAAGATTPVIRLKEGESWDL